MSEWRMRAMRRFALGGSAMVWAISILTAMASATAAEIAFRDAAAEWGVRFRFENGSRGKRDLPEIMGGGLAIFDADGDGRLDLYFCNGGPIVNDPKSSAKTADPPCRLFLQREAKAFHDAAETANAPGPSYAMGAAVGDYDGDRLPDLFVAGWRDQRLYRNRGGGRFEDVTERAGLRSSFWSTSAAFADLDGDGDLDLYVANYVAFDPAKAPFCAAPDGQRDYCGPEDFVAQPDFLYRNNGDGTFTEISKQAGTDSSDGRGLGVLIADLCGDERPDILVANDGSPFFLFENRGAWRFAEVAQSIGIGVDGAGTPLAGMGLALGDPNGDGRPAVAATNFRNRGTVLFQSQGKGAFFDRSSRSGFTLPTLNVLGFGVAWGDFDNDGDQDLIQTNGHVLDRERLGIPFAMPATVLENRAGKFADVTASSGDWLNRPVLGRGMGVADLDRDGRLDIVVNPINAPAAILRNVSPPSRSLRLDWENPPPVGTSVRAAIGGKVQHRWIAAGGSYATAAPPEVHFGLGTAEAADLVEIRYPTGERRRIERVPRGAIAIPFKPAERDRSGR